MYSVQQRRLSVADSLLEGVKAPDGRSREAKPRSPTPVHSYYYAAVTTLLVLIPSIGLVIWAARVGSVISHNYGLDSQPLGGRLTLVQAKAIDFVCSALIAPLVLVAVNWYWFSVTRVTVLNDGSTTAMPLAALVEASHTDTGSYSPVKLTSLVRSGRPKMVLLGLLVFLSAVSQTCFSNVIAYEAHSVSDVEPSTVPLRALVTGLPSFIGSGDSNAAQDRSMHIYNFTQAQRVSFMSQATSMLSDIAFAGSAGKLSSDGTYVGMNVTQSSLDQLLPNITGLRGVPAYRVSIHCSAAPNDHVGVTNFAYNQVTASTFVDNKDMFQSWYAGQVDAVTNEWVDFESWLAFNYNYNETYFFHMMRFNQSNHTDPSPYGTITYAAQNMTRFGYQGTKGVMSSWGFRCNLQRESGFSTLSRNRDLSWRQEDIDWTGKQEPMDWLIGDWQLALNYRSPVSMGGQPGFGPALAATALLKDPEAHRYSGDCSVRICLDYPKSISNLLYAAGETERLAYETRNTNASSLGQGATHAVKATITREAYRMTYVPLLLLCGLLSAFLAALIPFGLLLHGRRTNSVRTWREVNTLQLMADTVTGLRDEYIVEQMKAAGPNGSGKLARTAKVKYEVLGGKKVSLKLVNDSNKDRHILVSGEDTEVESGQ